MADYTNDEAQNYWNNGDMSNMNYYEADYSQFQNQQLEFKPLEEYSEQNYSNYNAQMYNPANFEDLQKGTDEFDEPPLLEELEIYPDRILEKVLAVLNPLRGHSLTDDAEYLTKDSDLAGPIFFCIIFGVCLFLSGHKVNFGYIYGISLISCILMYCLLSLMTPVSGTFTLYTVASILGYCLIPIVGLSAIGLFLNLPGILTTILSIVAILWSSYSASRLFVAVSGDRDQQPLIAYPSAIVYGVYTLLAVF